jgi:O-antigen ligase
MSAFSTKYLGAASIDQHDMGALGKLPGKEKTPARVMFVYFMWILVWYEPDWFAATHLGTDVFVKLYVLMYLPVFFLLAKYVRREAVFWPYLLVLAIHVMWIPFAPNRGLVYEGLMKIFQFCVLFSLTISVLDTPRQMIPLLKLFFFQFIWWGVQGLYGPGNVWWHHLLSNEDSFGPLMTIGLGYSYYLVMGTNEKGYRRWAFLVCLLCVAGTVLSFARGALITLCTVLGVIAVCAPKKLVFFGLVAIFAVVGLVAIQIAFPQGEFWVEMETIFSEGMEDGTGLQRWVVWTLAWDLFTLSPLVGVGPGNFGWSAAEHYLKLGMTDLGSTFDTPEKLYMFDLHNDFVQIMVEQGVVGLFGLLAMLVYFRKATKFLRTEPVRKVWQEDAGGFIDSVNLALGLEAAMVAYLASAIFYNQYEMNWVWSIIMLALVAASLARRALPHSPRDPALRRNLIDSIATQEMFRDGHK